MKLFRKQLHSMEELRREKLRLLIQKSQSPDDHLFPVKEFSRSKKKKDGEPGLLQSVMSVASAKSPMGIALALAGPAMKILLNRRKEKSRDKAKAYEPSEPKKHYLRKAAVEIIGGYIVYKVVQLSVGLLRDWLHKRSAQKKLAHAYARHKK